MLKKEEVILYGLSFDGTYKDMKIKGFEEAISHRYVDEGDDDLHPYPIEDLDCEA